MGMVDLDRTETLLLEIDVKLTSPFIYFIGIHFDPELTPPAIQCRYIPHFSLGCSLPNRGHMPYPKYISILNLSVNGTLDPFLVIRK